MKTRERRMSAFILDFSRLQWALNKLPEEADSATLLVACSFPPSKGTKTSIHVCALPINVAIAIHGTACRSRHRAKTLAPEKGHKCAQSAFPSEKSVKAEEHTFSVDCIRAAMLTLARAQERISTKTAANRLLGGQLTSNIWNVRTHDVVVDFIAFLIWIIEHTFSYHTILIRFSTIFFLLLALEKSSLRLIYFAFVCFGFDSEFPKIESSALIDYICIAFSCITAWVSEIVTDKPTACVLESISYTQKQKAERFVVHNWITSTIYIWMGLFAPNEELSAQQRKDWNFSL